jgi:Mg-chelatase subunit ChlI
MRLRLSDPHLVPDLLQFLESRLEVVVERIGENEVELSLIGSYNPEAERMTVDLLLRAWEAGRDAPGSVEFAD